MARVLIIGDTHCPWMHSGYIRFLLKIAREYKTNRVVHIGDLVDWSSISYHQKAASVPNPEKEFAKARKQVRRLYRAFPQCDWLIGNHDSLTERKAADLNLPLEILKSYEALWEVPKWKVHQRYEDLIIDDVLYRHGDKGRGGRSNAAVLNSQDEHMSVVQGHHHSQAGVAYHQTVRHRTFGLQVGCGIDYEVAAMEYGRKFNSKPILGCGVVINGQRAIFEPM